MKETKYFYGVGNFNSDITATLKNVISERDHFIQQNQESIGEIESEHLSMQSGGPNDVVFVLVIQLTYYPKETK